MEWALNPPAHSRSILGGGPPFLSRNCSLSVRGPNCPVRNRFSSALAARSLTHSHVLRNDASAHHRPLAPRYGKLELELGASSYDPRAGGPKLGMDRPNGRTRTCCPAWRSPLTCPLSAVACCPVADPTSSGRPEIYLAPASQLASRLTD